MESICEISADEDEGYPVPFVTISFDEENRARFCVTDEAKLVLSRIKHPISVISIVGMCRTGKSFLLNRILLNRKDGFPVGSTGQFCPCLKGCCAFS